MAKLNIHDLAKELKREESEIISLCSSKGMSGVTRATMLQDTMVEEVRKAFKSQQSQLMLQLTRMAHQRRSFVCCFIRKTAQSQFLKEASRQCEEAGR